MRSRAPATAGKSERNEAQRSKKSRERGGAAADFFGHRKRGCKATSSPSAPARKNPSTSVDGFFQLSLPLRASEAACGSEVHCVSEVSPYGEVGKLNFTLCVAQNFTMA